MVMSQKGSRFLHFGRELAKRDPRVSVKKVSKLWNLLEDFREREEHNLVKGSKLGTVLDIVA